MYVCVYVGGIVEPRTSKLYLRSGSKLNLVCEQTPTATSKEVVWSKAETYFDGDDEERQLKYQTVDSSQDRAPYMVSQRSFSDKGGADLLRSELVKDDVGRADSGYYRCRLGYGGESSRILVTVVDSTYRIHFVVSFTSLRRYPVM